MSLKFSVISTRNPANPYAYFLRDIQLVVASALRELGHDVNLVENRIEGGRIPILFSPQALPAAALGLLLKHDRPYVLYQSEILGDGTMNEVAWGEQFRRVMEPAMAGAAGIWEATRLNLPWYTARGLRADWLEPGFHQSLCEIQPRPRKDIKYLFYGSATPGRKRVFDALAARGEPVYYVFDAPPLFRNDLIARARVHLVPNQSETMRHLPYWRIVYQLHNTGVPVVEDCEDQDWLSECFLHAPTGSYVDLCIETANRPDVEDVGTALRARFAERRFVDRLAPLVAALEGR